MEAVFGSRMGLLSAAITVYTRYSPIKIRTCRGPTPILSGQHDTGTANADVPGAGHDETERPGGGSAGDAWRVVQEFLLVAAVRQVPEQARQKMAIGAWRKLPSLEGGFRR